MNAWRNFKGRHWTDDIDVRSFIQDNYTPYDGDESFLAEPTDATTKLCLDFRNSRKKNANTAAYWSARRKLYQA